MPQLSPINWLFLFVMFWSVISLATCLLWWMMIVKFSFISSSETGMEDGNKGSFWMFYNEEGSSEVTSGLGLNKG
uniref:ATP synthase F0 subunit 8 n=1 Tax=Lepetodrilus schrolli TaxID=205510 RepID=A0A0S1F5P2_9VEST|nr:ATP synthase F0 subunit 8 [Lepetodrilus schrolli]